MLRVYLRAVVPTMPPRYKPAHQRTTQQRKADADKARSEVPWRAWYGLARWQAIREAQFAIEPLCEMCKHDDIVTEADVCDHVTPHRGDEVLFWSGPFQSLCAHHHNSTKQREERAKPDV